MGNFCSKCGTALPLPEAKFCPSCGASTSTAPEVQAPPSVPLPTHPPDPARGVVRGAAALFLIIISTAVAVGLFFAVYLFLALTTYDFETSALIALVIGGITFMAGVGYAIQQTMGASDGGGSGRMFGRAVTVLLALACLGSVIGFLCTDAVFFFLAMLVFGALLLLTERWGK
jgi:hypothetical protein